MYSLHCLHIVLTTVLTCFRQVSPNEQYSTVKDLLLPTTFSQTDEKPHTLGLDDTAIPHINIKITEIRLEKKKKKKGKK